ncbi:MAG: haloacid dehalogenase-like hydrolase [Clostridia bacterium]|nr:haloacid dehalogenase-like hydrolase [Clostridia bacterium]
MAENMARKPIAALIYDFDKTLSPRDQQEYGFIPGLNMEPDVFWNGCRETQLANGMDSVLAYMMMMLDKSRGTRLLTRESLEGLGKSVEFFPGVESWFGRINRIGEQNGVQVEHYIISSGLKEIIGGSRIAKEFKAVFAASFVYDESGLAKWPATSVNYTEKTQHLFRINKGILDMTNDRDLNGFTPEYKRRVPFANMIYIGDGLTDVPCMKMTRERGGASICVYPGQDSTLADNMLLQNRCDFCVPADYTENSLIEQTVTLLFKRIAAINACRALHLNQVDTATKRGGIPEWQLQLNKDNTDLES